MRYGGDKGGVSGWGMGDKGGVSEWGMGDKSGVSEWGMGETRLWLGLASSV